MRNETTPRLRNRRRLGWPILTSLFSASGSRTYKGLPLSQPGESAAFLLGLRRKQRRSAKCRQPQSGLITSSWGPACLLCLLLVLAGCPEPNPVPPPPPPPPPVTALQVVFLYESEQVDDLPWLANILTSQKIRKLESADVDLVFADKDELDEKGETPAVIWPWVDMVAKENLSLPRLFFVDQDGELVAHESSPQEVDAVVALIQEYLP